MPISTGQFRIALVVAADPCGVIGQNGGLPWHIPEDLAWFKRVTMGTAMVMGRATWESIGHALPGRDSVVLTRDPGWRADGAHPAHSLDDALALAARLRPGRAVMVIGGAQVFAQALPLADVIYWTEVKARHPGDTVFPPFDRSEWRETMREDHERVAFVVLTRS